EFGHDGVKAGIRKERRCQLDSGFDRGKVPGEVVLARNRFECLKVDYPARCRILARTRPQFQVHASPSSYTDDRVGIRLLNSRCVAPDTKVVAFWLDWPLRPTWCHIS